MKGAIDEESEEHDHRHVGRLQQNPKLSLRRERISKMASTLAVHLSSGIKEGPVCAQRARNV